MLRASSSFEGASAIIDHGVTHQEKRPAPIDCQANDSGLLAGFLTEPTAWGHAVAYSSTMLSR